MSPSVSLHSFGSDITAFPGVAAGDGVGSAGVALVRDHGVLGRLRETFYSDDRLAVRAEMPSHFPGRRAVRNQEARSFRLVMGRTRLAPKKAPSDLLSEGARRN